MSVNAEGYEVSGNGDLLDEVAASTFSGFAFAINDDGVSELIASFPSCVASAEPEPEPEPEPTLADETQSTVDNARRRDDDLILAALLEEDVVLA